jgi:hypothetical protein
VALTLVNEKDMGSFQSIEKLIEKEIIKLTVPGELGKGPEWKVGRHRGKGQWRKDANGKKRNPSGRKHLKT